MSIVTAIKTRGKVKVTRVQRTEVISGLSIGPEVTDSLLMLNLGLVYKMPMQNC